MQHDDGRGWPCDLDNRKERTDYSTLQYRKCKIYQDQLRTMKKTFIFGMIMIAAICFIACSNDDDINEMMTGATTGSASDSGGRIISWVQLWAGGPKFAVNNIFNITQIGF